MDVKLGYKQTEVGIIPNNWDEALLEQFTKRGSGHTPDKKHPEYWNGEIKWISLADSPALDRVYISDTFAKITQAGIANSSAVLYPAGTVVLSRDAGVGKSAIMKTDMAVSQHFMAWRCGPELDNQYLYYWLQSAKPEFERVANGSTIKTIGLPYFQALKFPKPPSDEQKLVAKALTDVDALLSALDRLVAKKRDLRQAAMQQLLTGQTRLPRFSGEWKAKKLGKLFDFNGGYSASRDQLTMRGYCYLHYGDVHTSSKTFVDVRAEYEQIPKLDVKLSRISSDSLLKDGDVVFVDASEDDDGTSKHVVVVNKENLPFISGLHTIVAKAKTNELTHAYRRYCFQTHAVQQQFFFYAVGTKVSGISKTNIAKLTIPVPEPLEQDAIATVLMDMDAELADLDQQRNKIRDIKQGMMQELLTGRTRLS